MIFLLLLVTVTNEIHRRSQISNDFFLCITTVHQCFDRVSANHICELDLPVIFLSCTFLVSFAGLVELIGEMEIVHSLKLCRTFLKTLFTLWGDFKSSKIF